MRVWNVDSGGEMLRLIGHSGGVHGVAFSPDGTRLASASDDRTLALARLARAGTRTGRMTRYPPETFEPLPVSA